MSPGTNRDRRSVLVTGASSGIGRALALEYAAPGVFLALFGRDRERLETVAALCEARGATASIRIVDVRDAVVMRAAIEEADQAAPIDVAYVNAGVSSGRAPDGTPEGWDTARYTIDVNLFGALNTIAPLIDSMRRRGRGQIAVVGSLAARSAHPSCPSYSASKAAIEAYGLALRADLRAEGIAVNVVSPGYVVSAMSDRINGKKLMMISAEAAARKIRRGVEANRAIVAFPRSLAIAARLFTLAPDALRRRVLPLFAFSVTPEPPAR